MIESTDLWGPWEALQRRRYAEIPQSGAMVVGPIRKETYDWALEQVQLDWTYWKQQESKIEDLEHGRFMIAHARWIIEKVRDGTLSLPPLEVKT